MWLGWTKGGTHTLFYKEHGWKTSSWKTEKEMAGHKLTRREMGFEDVRWKEVA
jgi:hypothetical protein